MSTTVVFKSNVAKFLKEIKYDKAKAYYDIANIGVKNIKENTPVLSGDLQRANYGWIKDDSVYFVNEKDYARYIELGTMHMSPRYFMREALFNSEKEFMQVITRHMKR